MDLFAGVGFYRGLPWPSAVLAAHCVSGLLLMWWYQRHWRRLSLRLVGERLPEGKSLEGGIRAMEVRNVLRALFGRAGKSRVDPDHCQKSQGE